MSIVEWEVQTIEVHYCCDACGKGEMMPEGVALLTDPAQYPHKCTECGDKKTFFLIYPYTTTRRL